MEKNKKLENKINSFNILALNFALGLVSGFALFKGYNDIIFDIMFLILIVLTTRIDYSILINNRS